MVLLCNQLAETLDSKQWQASEASEQRRLALLPVSPALSWDTLMREARYVQALDLLP
jgi:beta-N-acetylhexosaminidase